jgi:hypothetical protein
VCAQARQLVSGGESFLRRRRGGGRRMRLLHLSRIGAR